jgi:hypothetical protein
MPIVDPGSVSHSLVITVWWEPGFRGRLRGVDPVDPDSSRAVADTDSLLQTVREWLEACRPASTG